MNRTLRILVHHMYYRPEPIGNGTYTGELCEWLANQGHRVRVVCPPPYYPYWKVIPPYSAWQYMSEVIDGVEVRRCPAFIPAQPKGLKRLLYNLSFVLSCFPVMFRMIFWRPDVVFVVEPCIANTVNALIVAKISRALAWLQVQDFEVDIAFDLGLIKSSFVKALAQKVESGLMRRFDRVSTISQTMLSRLRNNKGIDPARCVFFPNWVDPVAIYPKEGLSPMRAELNIPAEKIVALFSGTLGAKQNVELLIEAAKHLGGNMGIEIVICGDGAAVPRLKGLAAGLSNVRFLPLQPLDRLNDLLSMADIHLLPQQRSAADLVMPSKLLGMVASGRPVIATADPDTEVAAVVRECGIVVRPEDAEALSAAILELASDLKRRKRLGESARAIAVERLSKEVILRQFECAVLKLTTQRDKMQGAVATDAN